MVTCASAFNYYMINSTINSNAFFKLNKMNPYLYLFVIMNLENLKLLKIVMHDN